MPIAKRMVIQRSAKDAKTKTSNARTFHTDLVQYLLSQQDLTANSFEDLRSSLDESAKDDKNINTKLWQASITGIGEHRGTGNHRP